MARLPSVLAFIACIPCVACGGATAIVPDDGSGGTSENGGVTGAGGKPTGGVTGAGGKPTGGVTGAGGKPTGGVTGAGGKLTGGVTGAGGKPADGGSTSTSTRWAKEYDQSCAYDYECAGVTEGPVCTCNGCYNAAINRNESERWASAAGPCAPLPCPRVGCEEMVPVCFRGTCGVRPIDYIEPGQFDRTCSAQNDCYLVTVGDVCSGCSCEFDAVSAKGLEQYQARIQNGPSCGSPGIACDCAIPQAVCRFDGGRSQCAAVY